MNGQPGPLKRDLQIVAWNANGLAPRQIELVEFAARLKPDVLLVGETHLAPGKRFRLPNYVVYRNDRPGRAGGGTAIAVRANISHHRVDLPQRQHLECTAVELHGALGGVLVVSAYLPPNRELLRADMDAVFESHRRVIMAGDLNCKHSDWGSRMLNLNGKRLRQYADTARVTVLGPAQPTYFPTRARARPDVLDIAAVRGICCPVHVSVMSEMSSDHNPILVHAATQHPIARGVRRTIEWERFGPAFSRRLPERVPLDTVQQVDEAVTLFDTAVASAMEVSSRMKPGFTPHYQRIPDEVSLIACERNRLRRRWQRTRDPADKAAFNRATGKLRRDLQSFRRRCWELAVAEMDGPAEDRNPWRIPSALTGKRRRAQLPALTGPAGQILGRPEEKAEFLAGCFEQQFAPNPASNAAFANRVQHEIHRYLELPITAVPEPITEEEVSDRLVELQPRKAPGPDGVSNTALRRLPERGKLFLVDLFNACLRLTYFPLKWKTASVIVIPKPGKDASRADNLRPISLLSATSKVFERLVQRRVRDHLQRLDVLIPEQFGFRESHSTTQLLLRFVEYVTDSGCKGKQTVAFFLDVAKAFDRVWHEGVLFKLKEVLLPDCYVHLIASFLRDRTFRVRILDCLSSERPIIAGVPQGSVLGPLLFSVFVNDVPRVPGVRLSLFADDTAAYAAESNASYAAIKLQRQLDAYADWADDWRVAVNASKSTAVVFSRRLKRPRPLTVGNTQLPWANQVKYLGLHLDSKLTWRFQAQHIRKCASAQLHKLWPVLSSPAITPWLGRTIVNTYVLPIVIYAAPVWGYLAVSHRNTLQSVLDRGLRLAAKVPRRFPSYTLRKELGVRPLGETWRRIARKFYVRSARNTNNPLIAGLGKHKPEPGDSWKRPLSLLDLPLVG